MTSYLFTCLLILRLRCLLDCGVYFARPFQLCSIYLRVASFRGNMYGTWHLKLPILFVLISESYCYLPRPCGALGKVLVLIVCVCVSVTALVGATSSLKAKVRYQQKSLHAGNKTNVEIELKSLSSKLWQLLAYHEIFTRRLWQEIDASRALVLLEEDYWYIKHCVASAHEFNRLTRLHKLNCTAIMCFDLCISTHITKYNYIITLH